MKDVMKNTINPYFKTFLGQNVILNIHRKKMAKPHVKASAGQNYKTVNFSKEILDWTFFIWVKKK